jgi:hypothetical protein
MVRLTLSRNSAAISATLGKEADGSQLRLSESSIASRFMSKIRTDATFDFCNSIPSKADIPNPLIPRTSSRTYSAPIMDSAKVALH